MPACIWTKHGNGQTGFASCKQVYWHLSEEYRFCPFCGSPIDVRQCYVMGSTTSIPIIIQPRTEYVKIP